MSEIKLKGLDDLYKRINELGNKAGKVEDAALKEGAKIVQEEISKNAPRSDKPRQPGKKDKWRTGQHAADNIEVSKVKRKEGIKVVDVGITKGDNSPYFYLKFHEWGTSKMKATPFIQPSFENKRDEVIQTIKNEIKKGLGL